MRELIGLLSCPLTFPARSQVLAFTDEACRVLESINAGKRLPESAFSGVCTAPAGVKSVRHAFLKARAQSEDSDRASRMDATNKEGSG